MSKKDLDHSFSLLLANGNSDARSVLAFIRIYLHQYKICNHSECDILKKVYLRAITLVEQGEEIKNLVPWIRIDARRLIYSLANEHS